MSRLSRSEQEFVSSFDNDPAAAAPDAFAPLVNGPAPAQEVDARGISPPLPILRAHRALRAMKPGELLKVVTTQPQTVAEFQAMVKFMPDYELVSQEEEKGDYVHYLRKRR
jgi:tRNA 2-thiouridine synthesizing protein A